MPTCAGRPVATIVPTFGPAHAGEPTLHYCSTSQRTNETVHTLISAVNLILVLSVVLLLGRPQISIFGAAAQDSRYFSATGHTVAGRFLSYFDTYGGVQIFGLPISDKVTENGRAVQYFERQRFEYHAEA